MSEYYNRPPNSSLWGMFCGCLCALWIAPCAIVIGFLRPKQMQRIGTALFAFIRAIVEK